MDFFDKCKRRYSLFSTFCTIALACEYGRINIKSKGWFYHLNHCYSYTYGYLRII